MNEARRYFLRASLFYTHNALPPSFWQAAWADYLGRLLFWQIVAPNVLEQLLFGHRTNLILARFILDWLAAFTGN
jgi:hypothetical protein